MAIKVVAKIRAFYNGEIIKPGQIITLKEGIEIPSWAQKIDNKNTESRKKVQQEQISQPNANQTNTTIVEQQKMQQEANQENVEEFAAKTQEELLSILDELINKSIEMGITLENVENKTVVEQIVELRKLIAEKEEGQ